VAAAAASWLLFCRLRCRTPIVTTNRSHNVQQSKEEIKHRKALRQLLLNCRRQRYSKTRKQEKVRLMKDPSGKVPNHFVSDVINPAMPS
jgi:hypothetical protein